MGNLEPVCQCRLFAQSLQQINHPHCMRLFSVFDEPDRTYLILELIEVRVMLLRRSVTHQHHLPSYTSTPSLCVHGFTRCITADYRASLQSQPVLQSPTPHAIPPFRFPPLICTAQLLVIAAR